MKYIKFEYKPSKKMRKKMHDRWIWWFYYAFCLTVFGLYFHNDKASFGAYAIVTVATNGIIFAFLIPYGMNRLDSRIERKAQRAQQQD